MKKIVYFLFILSNTLAFAQSAIDKEDFQVPRNVGGKHEFKRLFEQELIYPVRALRANIGGKLELKFKVKADSTVEDVNVLLPADPDLSAEALKIFRLIQWVPARGNSGNIDTYASLVFNFQAKKYDDLCKKRGYTVIPYPNNLPIDTSLIVYGKVDEMPKYPDGGEALAEFISKNIRYPAQMTTLNISGKVVLKFVVEPSGMPSNIGIEKALGAGCDEEAIRVLSKIKWKPAVKKGKIVRAKMSMTFPFLLSTSYR